MDDRDPTHRQYMVRWQAEFCLGAKRSGRKAIIEAHRYVSAMRAMRRHALAGGKPELLRFLRQPPPAEAFILDRNNRNISRAVKRGEHTEAIRRRGLFDPLRYHQAYRQFPTRRKE